MSGSNFILHGCGILGAYVAMSYEKFLADEELCGMVRRMLKEIDVSDKRIDFETIEQVGIGGEYLTHPTTFERCRTEFFLPDLMTREDYQTWKRSGKRGLDRKATDRLAQRLAAYEKPEIEPEIEQDLSRYVAKRKNE